MRLPVSRLPKSKAFYLDSVIPHRSIGIRTALNIQIDEFFEISPDNLVCCRVSPACSKLRPDRRSPTCLIRVNKDDPLQLDREQDVQKKNFISDRPRGQVQSISRGLDELTPK